MSKVLNIFFTTAIFIGLGYAWHSYTLEPCDSVLQYSIGRFDGNFGLSREQFRTYAAEAEKVWEKAADKNLFEYRADAEFSVNLIYDERQRATIEKQRTESGLAAAENFLKTLDSKFASAKSRYGAEVDSYEAAKAALEKKSSEYQSEVNYWNSKGGAPPEEFNKLEEKRRLLNSEVDALNHRTDKVNSMASELNLILNDRNRAANEYNKVVGVYNKKYGTSAEFNQADYLGSSINIYQFSDSKSLVTALSHEFGHALSMDHVDSSDSLMFYLREGSDSAAGLSEDDIAELKRVCPSIEI